MLTVRSTVLREKEFGFPSWNVKDASLSDSRHHRLSVKFGVEFDKGFGIMTVVSAESSKEKEGIV